MRDMRPLLHSFISPGQNTGVGKPISSPGDLPTPGIKPRLTALEADSSPSEPIAKPIRYLTVTQMRKLLLPPLSVLLLILYNR